MKVMIVNNLRQKIEEYQECTGCSKRWIADQLGISTQWLFKLFEKDNIDIVTLTKIAILINCDPQELITINVEK